MQIRAAGHVAYFAGGCVRDLLLGLEPKDWDVATDALPQRVRRIFPDTQAVGQAFGVILVRHRHSTIEVATFRSEGTYSDGRRPDSVRFTTAEEDASRRDFTINGLFLDPGEESCQLPVASCQSGSLPIADCRLPIDAEAAGQRPADAPTSTLGTSDSGLPPGNWQLATGNSSVIDFVGGIPDLQARILRAIGDPAKRFAEDHLRLLRAVRFAARLGFEIEPLTAQAIRANAPHLRSISPERIADELRHILTPPARIQGWRMLWKFALINIVFRLLPSSQGVEFDPARSLFLRLAPEQSISFGLALAAAVLDYRLQSAPNTDPVQFTTRPEIHHAARALRDALKISNQERDEVAGILGVLPTLLAGGPPTVAATKRFLAQPTAGATRQLLDALAALDIHAPRVRELQGAFEHLANQEVAPPPLITGDDLTAAGFKPGPLFRRILTAVYDAQLEHRVSSRHAAMELARELGKSE